MNYSIENASIALPITSHDKQRALTFANQQVTSEKGERIYKNTLAVLVAHRYLEMIGIPSEPENSYNWNPITRFSADIADLFIPETNGRLECRAVEEEEQSCFVPEETWENRIGYVAVRLNKDHTEGTVLGFVPEVSVERLPLSYLRSLDDLIDRIAEQARSTQRVTNLGDWLEGAIAVGWQKIEELLRTNDSPGWVVGSTTRFSGKTPEELVEIIQTTKNEQDRWYAAGRLQQLDPENAFSGEWRATDRDISLEGHFMRLVVAILPKTDGKRAILLRVYPTNTEIYLPIGLKIRLLDNMNNLQGETDEAGSKSPGRELFFLADTGDRFNAQIVLGEAAVTESFIA